MAVYEAGRESSILDDILAGRKTIEVRLDRGKFSDFKPGDQVHLREDTYEAGVIKRSLPDQAVTEIVEINKYPSFHALFESEGFDHAAPKASSVNEAIAVCRQFYSEAEEQQYGVLAIHFKLLRGRKPEVL